MMFSPKKFVLSAPILFIAAVLAIAMNSPQGGDLTSYVDGVEALSFQLDCGTPPRKPCGKLVECGSGCPTVGRLQQVTKLKTISDLVIVLVPRGNPVLLKALALEFQAAGKVISSHKLKLLQEKPYPPIAGSEKVIRGYTFALDQDAAKMAEKFFVPSNTIGIRAEVAADKGGGKATFYLVNAKSKLPDGGSK